MLLSVTAMATSRSEVVARVEITITWAGAAQISRVQSTIQAGLKPNSKASAPMPM